MRSIILICLALIVITSAVYWQVGDHEFLNLDDYAYITENPHVSTGITGPNIVWAFTSAHASNWHPITWLSHMTDVQLYGMNPRGHHLTNVVIHAFSAALLFLLLFRLTSSLWQCVFVAALFAIHPLHVESVAWVAERKDVLSAFFGFLTILFYAEYAARRKPTLYLLSLSSFVLGLMSKPMLVTLPAILLLLDFWPLNRGSIKEQEQMQGQRQLSDNASALTALLKEKIPFFACSLFSAAITIYAQHKGGAISSLNAVPFGLRIENALMAYVEYITNTFWPHDLAVLYLLPSSIPVWQDICSLLILLIVSAATIWGRRRHPYLAVGWFWFLITLLPVIGLIQVGYQSMADRYTYIPLIGLFVMAAWGVPALIKELQYRQVILALLAGAVIIASTALTRQQLGYWRDNVSLFRHTLHVTSGNYIARYYLGLALANKGDLSAAIKEYQEVLAINPSYFEAHNNLGGVLANKGDLDAAIKAFQAALTINPNYFEAHNNLGGVLANKGDLNAAVEQFQKALSINPNYFKAHNNLGLAFAKKGDLDAAIKEFQEALAINPNSFSVHNNLGFAHARRGDLVAAIKEFREALAIDPDSFEVRNNLEIALELMSKRDKGGK